jgi:hypothetical protein
MSKHLLRRPATACLDMGERILPKLWVDPGLTDAATALQAGQDRLDVKWAAYERAAETARSAAARRDQAHRDMEDRLREFALNVLSVVRNNHESDTYLRYFPVGYGNALRETPEQIREVTRVILGQLDGESDPWLVTFRNRIARALETFAAAQDLCDTAVGNRRAAFAYLVAERRSWVQALSVSRLEARIAYLDDEAYLRGIFSPADVRRRATTPALAESDGLPATTSQPETQGVLASLHLIGSPGPQKAGHAPMAQETIPGRNRWFDIGGGLRRMLW